MNISEKKRAEEYATKAITAIANDVPAVKLGPVSQEGKDAVAAFRNAKEKMEALGVEPASNGKSVWTYGKRQEQEAARHIKQYRIHRVLPKIVRGIWNNDVTFDNIDEAIEEAVANAR